jgi:hypothetical protein
MGRFRTRNYEIIDNKRPVTDDVIKACARAYARNRRFFKRDYNFFRIHIYHSEKDFRKAAKRFYQPWVKGVSFRGKKIVIRSPDFLFRNYKKFGGTPDFEMMLAHEINHLYASLLNMYRGPYWMTEGLAMYVAGQIPGDAYKHNINIVRKKAEKALFYRLIMRKLCMEMYVVDYLGIAYIIKRFGKEKLVRLIGGYPESMKRKDFEKRFRRIFGIGYRDFLRDFISETFPE